MTQKYKILSNITGFLSVLLTIGVPLGYAIAGFINTAHMNDGKRLVVGAIVVAALIIGVLNILLKTKIRTLVWVLLLLSSVALGGIQTLVILMCVTSLLDEFIMTPLHNKYKQKYIINKELDDRLNEQGKVQSV